MLMNTVDNRKFISYVPLLLKLLLIAAFITGYIDTAGSGEFMSQNSLLYFTVQSNIWIAAVCALFAVFETVSLVRGRRLAIPNVLLTVKYMCTIAIALTFVVFSLILSPPLIAGGQAAYLATPGNICLHNAVPVIAIIDFILYDHGLKSSRKTFLLSAVLPLYYLAFALICSFSGVDFGGGAKVPYFFLDYERNGWFSIGGGKFGVVYWIVIMILLVLGMGLLFIAIKNKAALRAARSKSGADGSDDERAAAE